MAELSPQPNLLELKAIAERPRTGNYSLLLQGL